MCTDDASLICEEDSRMNHECGKASRFPAAGASVHRAKNFRMSYTGVKPRAGNSWCERLMQSN